MREASTGSIETCVLLTQPGLGFIREAELANQFGRLLGARKARNLVFESRPDFQLHIDEGIRSFEAVEILDPERRRSAEYRQGCEIREESSDDMTRRRENFPAWIKDACKKKSYIDYPIGTELLLYLNVGPMDGTDEQIVTTFPESVQPAVDRFKLVHVLWKLRVYTFS